MTCHADSNQQARRLWYMCHQKLHLICQYATVAQNEIFPQAGYVRRVEQRHVGLLWRAAAFAVITGAAGRNNVHPGVDAFLRKRDDVLSGQIFFMKMRATVGTHIAITSEQFDVGQPWLQIKRVDVGHTLGADDAIDIDYGLVARDGVVAAMKGGHLRAHLPTHLV